MRRLIDITVYAMILVLTPSLVMAGEGVDVSFSVQSIRIQDAVASHMSGKAQWALVAVDIGNGESLVSAGGVGSTPFIPGSLMKLFVAAAVLEKNSLDVIDLGASIAVQGKISNGKFNGNVIVKGAGNPFLSTKDLLGGIEKIKALGIKEISGDIIIDDSLFDVKEWKTKYSGPAYGVPSALGLDMHTVSITTEGNPRKISVDPPNDAVKVSINPSGKPDIRQIDDLTYEVTGAKLDAPTIHKRFPLADPALYAGGTFLTLIKKVGIRVAGNVKRRLFSSPKRGEGTEVIARIGSPDIKAFIQAVNQQSLNAAADNLLFLLGALEYGAPGTRQKGVQAVNDFLTRTGVPLEGFVMDDGSGLSQKDRMSAEQMVALLQAASKKPWFDAFYKSLSRPGLDGRLQDFGYRSDRMRLKSGQVRDAYCLAGYVAQKNGRRAAFAFMINGPDANVPTAGTAAVEVLKQLEQ